MAYIDGFVIAVPTADRQKFVDHASTIDPLFKELGALRVVECWGDDVPHGKQTDFYGAVAAKVDETVAFSWIEWPDKATRDAGLAKMTAMMDGPVRDPRMDPAKNPMPFDGKRMIYGGFVPMIDNRADDLSTTGYVDGFVTPVAPANRDAYLALETRMAAKFLAAGARRFAEHWGDDVPDGQVTDFKRAVQATGDEAAVFCWFEWPDKPTRDAAWAKLMADPDMQPNRADMPFDGKRMIYGGFEPVVEL
jgi:uncharacterized protein YbaA (DUF1428 family)